MFKTVGLYPSTIAYLWLTNTTRMTHLEEKPCVYCAVRDEPLNANKDNFMLQRVKARNDVATAGLGPARLTFRLLCYRELEGEWQRKIRGIHR